MQSSTLSETNSLPQRLEPAPVGDRRWLAALIFFLAAFALYHSNARFPYYYHTDEPGKVRQVLTETRNFHHPLLLLNSTEWAMKFLGTPQTEQSAVEMGRTLSAFYAALSVSALSLLAWTTFRPAAGILAGLLALSHSILFELAHYMKEDCALLAGMTWCFFLLALYDQQPSSKRAGLAGIAAGFAVSGKFVGAGMLVVGLLLIGVTRRKERQSLIAEGLAFFVAAALVFSFINIESLVNLSGANAGLDSEFERINKSRESSGWRPLKYTGKISSDMGLPLLAGVFIWAAGRWKNRHQERFFSWLLILFPVALFFGLSAAPVAKERYLLPVFMFTCVVGSLGIVELAGLSPRYKKWAIGLAILALAWNLPKLVFMYRDFAGDDRRDLIVWINQNLPPETIIAEDVRARLKEAKQSGNPTDAVKPKILDKGGYAAEIGTLQELQKQGVRYVVTCDYDYQRAQVVNRSKKERAKIQPVLEFYKKLFADGKLLWQRPPRELSYLHPGIRLYELPEKL